MLERLGILHYKPLAQILPTNTSQIDLTATTTVHHHAIIYRVPIAKTSSLVYSKTSAFYASNDCFNTSKYPSVSCSWVNLKKNSSLRGLHYLAALSNGNVL